MPERYFTFIKLPAQVNFLIFLPYMREIYKPVIYAFEQNTFGGNFFYKCNQPFHFLRECALSIRPVAAKIFMVVNIVAFGIKLFFKADNILNHRLNLIQKII